MLVCKAYEVGFELISRRGKLWCPKTAAMLHDEDGTSWPKCSVLIARFTHSLRRATDEEVKGAPKNWLGRKYDADIGSVDLPPRSLSSWTRVGDIRRMYYERIGTKAPGRYQHGVNKPRGLFHVVWLFKGDGEATLYKRGRVWRVEMSKNCIFDDRGIVYP